MVSMITFLLAIIIPPLIGAVVMCMSRGVNDRFRWSSFFILCCIAVVSILFVHSNPSQAAPASATAAINSYTYDRSPSGSICGTTGRSPNIVEIQVLQKNHGKTLEVEVRKCNGEDFGQNGRVELWIDNRFYKQQSYRAGTYEIEFQNLDPIAENAGNRGFHEFKAYVYSADQPTIAKDTGVVRFWEVYDTPTDVPHNLTYDIQPYRERRCGNIVALELVQYASPRMVGAEITKCDNSQFSQNGYFYIAANGEPFLGPIRYTRNRSVIFHDFDPADYGLAGNRYTYTAVVYSDDQPLLPKISGGISAIGQEPTPPVYRYTAFDGSTFDRYVFEGDHVVLLAADPYLDQATMSRILAGLDRAYEYYWDATGREPTLFYQYNGKATIAVVPSTCGAGCAYLGHTGIELLTDYWNLLYDGVATRNEFDHVAFYELGRNFWFYGDQIEYKNNDSTGSVTTGFAVFMRFMSIEAANLNGGPFNGYPFATFQAEVEGLLDLYLADNGLTWANTMKIGRAPTNRLGLGGADLLASFLFALRERHGANFVSDFWQEVGQRPAASTTQAAVDNFVIAASYAANENLANLFVNEWRWPLSTQARNELDQHFSEPIQEGIVLSSNRNGRLPGIGQFKDEDILLYSPSNNSWQLLFDGSDVGLQTSDIDAFTFLPNGNLLLSVERDFTLNGAFTTSGSALSVDDADVLEFMPTLLGGTTRGKFRVYLDGSTVQLNTSAEDIDALFLNQGGMLLMSVLGALKTDELVGADEDLFRYHADLNAWVSFFDGSGFNLTSAKEDIIAAHKAGNQLYFSTKGNYNMQSQNALSGSPGDIVRCTLSNGDTRCYFDLYWRGRDHGLGSSAVDALYIGTVPQALTLSPTNADEVDAADTADDDDSDEPDELDGFEEEFEEEAAAIQIFLPLVTR